MALSDNLISFWELEEASGTRNDSHGSNHLTDNNTVLSATGKVGTAADFERDNSESLTCADNASLSIGSSDFTICVWAKLEADVTFSLVTKANASVGEYTIQHSASGFFRVRTTMFSSEVSATDTHVFPSPGNWYFIVVRKSGTNLSISVNDNTPVVNTGAAASLGDTAAGFILGWWDFSGYFDGLMDQVGFWKRAISDAEVTFLYNSGAGRTYAEIAGSPPAVSDYRIIPPTLNFIQPAGQLAIVPATA